MTKIFRSPDMRPYWPDAVDAGANMPAITPENEQALSAGGRPLTWGFSSKLVPHPSPKSSFIAPANPDFNNPQIKLLTWASPDNKAHALTIQFFQELQNSSLYNTGPTFEIYALVSWQTDAGSFEAEVDVVWGTTISIVAKSVTVTIVEWNGPNVMLSTFKVSATLTMDGVPSNRRATRTFNFFDVAPAVRPDFAVAIPEFAKSVYVLRRPNTAALSIQIVSNPYLGIPPIPAYGLQSTVPVLADMVTPLPIPNGMSRVFVGSPDPWSSISLVFNLDL